MEEEEDDVKRYTNITPSLLNAILAVQACAQGVKNVRPQWAACHDCEQGHGKGKGKEHAGGEEEEVLLGEAENDAESEAGPSGEAPAASYRDEPEGAEAA